LRPTGVIAATLALVTVSSGCSGSRSAEEHSRGPTDQRFIQTTSVDLTALGQMTADYRDGDADAKELARHAFDAAARVKHTDPKDPSLRAARTYLDAMFQEYGTAVTLQAKGGDAGARMYRAYGLANFARDVLAQAQPALYERGCDVEPLL
jgi:hypothetical protein